MKRTLLKTTCAWLFLAMFAPMTASAEDIEINATNFPDANFRNWLLEQDYGQNGVITDEEIEYIRSISVGSKNISSLKGIEHFTALTSLRCERNQLTSLDVSQNTALTELRCDYNQLTSLDVSQNAALTELWCWGNELTTLDVSQNTALTELHCNYNQLTSLDVSQNTALTWLACSYNQLTSLDVSQNTALTDLNCSSNQLTSLNVSQNTALTTLSCDYNQLPSLDVSQNTALTRLECGSNPLPSLDVSQNTALTWLSCSSNQLISLDVSKNTALTDLYCYRNQLTSLDVSKNTALKYLYCYSNQLTSLDVSKNTALTELRCYSNQLKGIAMDAFIASLPVKPNDKEYSLYIYYYNDGNVCTHSQVEDIKARGWTPYDYRSWSEYEGCDDETIVETVSVGEDGLATYCPAFNIDFSKAEKIAAYKASVDGNTVNLTKVTTVAAGEGVLLRSINGGAATEELPTAADAEKDADNAFVGTLTTTTLSENNGDFTNFVLSKVNNVVGFYKANDTPIAAWKAYLPVENYNADAGARGLTIVFDDGNTTSISEIDNTTTADNAIYTLGGARVKNPAKGLYIKNGKKVIVK